MGREVMTELEAMAARLKAIDEAFLARHPHTLTIGSVTFRAIDIGRPDGCAFVTAERADRRLIGDVWLSRTGRLIRLKSKDGDKTRIVPMERATRERVKAWIRQLQENNR